MCHVAEDRVDYFKNDGRQAAVIQFWDVLHSRSPKRWNVLRKRHLYVLSLPQAAAFLRAQILQTCHVFTPCAAFLDSCT